MAENSSTFGGAKKAWADPKARKGMLASAAILVVVGGIAFAMSNRQQARAPEAPSSATGVPPPSGQRDVTGQSTEQYKLLVAQSDKERAEKAAANPTSVVMPTLAGFGNDDEARRREAEERGKAAALAQGQKSQPQAFQTTAQAAGMSNGQQGPSASEMARSSKEYAKTTEYLTGVVANAVAQPLTPIMNREPRAADSQNGQGGPGNSGSTGAQGQSGQGGQGGMNRSGGSADAYASSGANGQGGSAGPTGTPLVRVGEVLFSTTDVAINSDYSGPVTATVRQGKFAGSRLIGQKTLERDAIVVKFNLMSPANGGAALPVNAYAVSMGDAQKYGLTGLEGQTNNHVFQRYVLPAAMAFVQSYGMSGMQQGSTAVVSNGGAVGTTTPGLSSSDRIGIALGGAMTPLLSDVARQSARPVTVSLPAQTEIGIMFAADVYEGGKMGASLPADTSASVSAASAANSAAAAAAQQPMQVPPQYQVPYPTPAGPAGYGGGYGGYGGYGNPGYQGYPGTPGYTGGYRYPQ